MKSGFGGKEMGFGARRWVIPSGAVLLCAATVVWAKPPATETPTPSPTTTPAGTSTPVGTGTPSTTATPSPTPTSAFNPSAPPVQGGMVQVLSSVDLHTTDGETVSAGSFQIANTTDSVETINSVHIEVTNGAMFTSMTLTGGEQSATVDSPGFDNFFIFSPGVDISPGDAVAFVLSGTIGSGSTSSTPTPNSSATSTPAPTSTPSFTAAGMLGGGSGGSSIFRGTRGRRGRAIDGLGIIAAITGLLAAILGIGERRWRRVAGIGLAIAGIALYAGCGTEESSSQTVRDIDAANETSFVNFDGLPASLGTVSRPQPLIFPGAS
jgi:hypothetical protein